MRPNVPLAMKVLILDNNLIWNQRLSKSVAALGNEPVVHAVLPEDIEGIGVAILNLSSTAEEILRRWVAQLRQAGVYTIGHAGHKEKHQLEIGNEVGCDAVLSNSSVTFKLEAALEEAKRQILTKKSNQI